MDWDSILPSDVRFSSQYIPIKIIIKLNRMPGKSRLTNTRKGRYESFSVDLYLSLMLFSDSPQS